MTSGYTIACCKVCGVAFPTFVGHTTCAWHRNKDLPAYDEAHAVPVRRARKKNACLKERKIDNPYEVWESFDGTWTWKVLKKWQVDDDKPFARWLCAVSSPMTYGSHDIGDVYVADIKRHARRVK